MTASARRSADIYPPLMTADEFFDMPDDGTDTKYELVDGHLVAMAPAHPIHGRLQAEVARLIGNHLQAHLPNCWIATEIRVQPSLNANTNVRIPDLGVSCRDQVRADKGMPQPVLLVEILSPSNVRDTNANVWMYATMPSVTEILLVHSTTERLELFQRAANGGWPAEAEIAEVGQALTLKSIGMALKVDELYRGIPLYDSGDA
jgi:Uma2 family endonuclease